MGCGLWVVSCGLWVVGCGLWVNQGYLGVVSVPTITPAHIRRGNCCPTVTTAYNRILQFPIREGDGARFKICVGCGLWVLGCGLITGNWG
jgi:hypothetical protein